MWVGTIGGITIQRETVLVWFDLIQVAMSFPGAHQFHFVTIRYELHIVTPTTEYFSDSPFF